MSETKNVAKVIALNKNDFKRKIDEVDDEIISENEEKKSKLEEDTEVTEDEEGQQEFCSRVREVTSETHTVEELESSCAKGSPVFRKEEMEEGAASNHLDSEIRDDTEAGIKVVLEKKKSDDSRKIGCLDPLHQEIGHSGLYIYATMTDRGDLIYIGWTRKAANAPDQTAFFPLFPTDRMVEKFSKSAEVHSAELWRPFFSLPPAEYTLNANGVIEYKGSMLGRHRILSCMSRMHVAENLSKAMWSSRCVFFSEQKVLEAVLALLHRHNFNLMEAQNLVCTLEAVAEKVPNLSSQYSTDEIINLYRSKRTNFLLHRGDEMSRAMCSTFGAIFATHHHIHPEKLLWPIKDFLVGESNKFEPVEVTIMDYSMPATTEEKETALLADFAHEESEACGKENEMWNLSLDEDGRALLARLGYDSLVFLHPTFTRRRTVTSLAACTLDSEWSVGLAPVSPNQIVQADSTTESDAMGDQCRVEVDLEAEHCEEGDTGTMSNAIKKTKIECGSAEEVISTFLDLLEGVDSLFFLSGTLCGNFLTTVSQYPELFAKLRQKIKHLACFKGLLGKIRNFQTIQMVTRLFKGSVSSQMAILLKIAFAHLLRTYKISKKVVFQDTGPLWASQKLCFVPKRRRSSPPPASPLAAETRNITSKTPIVSELSAMEPTSKSSQESNLCVSGVESTVAESENGSDVSEPAESEVSGVAKYFGCREDRRLATISGSALTQLATLVQNGELKFEETSTNLVNCLPPSSIIIDARFYKTLNDKGEAVGAEDFHLMNIGLCYPHPEADNKICRQFIAVEPLQRAAARQLGYKEMSGSYYFQGRLCISQTAAIKLVKAVLSKFTYIFTRDLIVLRQLVRLPGWKPAPHLKAEFVGVLTAEGRFIQSLGQLMRQFFHMSWRRVIPDKGVRSDRMADRVYSCLSLIVGNAGPGQLQLPLYAASVLHAPVLSRLRLQEALVYLIVAVPAISPEDRKHLAAMLRPAASSPPAESAATEVDNKTQPKTTGENKDDSVGAEVEDDCSAGADTSEQLIIRTSPKNVVDASLPASPPCSVIVSLPKRQDKEKSLSQSSPNGQTQHLIHDVESVPVPMSPAGTGRQPSQDCNVRANEEHCPASAEDGEDHAVDESSIIDEIVEECLMADEAFREERLKMSKAQVAATRETSRKRGGKRVVVEVDPNTRLICILQPPPSMARPPFQIQCGACDFSHAELREFYRHLLNFHLPERLNGSGSTPPLYIQLTATYSAAS